VEVKKKRRNLQVIIEDCFNFELHNVQSSYFAVTSVLSGHH